MKSLMCLSIREQIQAEALCCLNPIETRFGFKVNTLVTHRGINISMKILEDQEHLVLYFRGIHFVNKMYVLHKNGFYMWGGGCPPVISDIINYCSKNTQILLLHSAYCQYLRMNRHGYICEFLIDAIHDAVDCMDITHDLFERRNLTIKHLIEFKKNFMEEKKNDN